MLERSLTAVHSLGSGDPGAPVEGPVRPGGRPCAAVDAAAGRCAAQRRCSPRPATGAAPGRHRLAARAAPPARRARRCTRRTAGSSSQPACAAARASPRRTTAQRAGRRSGSSPPIHSRAARPPRPGRSPEDLRPRTDRGSRDRGNRWLGDPLDVRIIAAATDGREAVGVAGYLAKYATKSSAADGQLDHRLRHIAQLADFDLVTPQMPWASAGRRCSTHPVRAGLRSEDRRIPSHPDQCRTSLSHSLKRMGFQQGELQSREQAGSRSLIEGDRDGTPGKRRGSDVSGRRRALEAIVDLGGRTVGGAAITCPGGREPRS